MTRPVLVLRPPPGDAATATRLIEAGLQPIRLPLFAATPLEWRRPDGSFDALLLTSANAVRHAGPGLAALCDLPVVAVGAATADAARAAGLTVAVVGGGDAETASALARARGWLRMLRLAGRERIPLADVTDVPVYGADPVPLPPGALAVAAGAVALLHSPRAARRFAALIDRDTVDRTAVRIAALSPAVAAAAGEGWACAPSADRPTDAALVALAARLAIDRSGRGGDKAGHG